MGCERFLGVAKKPFSGYEFKSPSAKKAEGLVFGNVSKSGPKATWSISISSIRPYGAF